MSRRGSRSSAAKLVAYLNENSRKYITKYQNVYKDTKAFDYCSILLGITNYNN